MDFTNHTWREETSVTRLPGVSFWCDASDIGLEPGVRPSPNTVRDPWDRRGPVFVARWNANHEVERWEGVVQGPDGKDYLLVIFND